MAEVYDVMQRLPQKVPLFLRSLFTFAALLILHLIPANWLQLFQLFLHLWLTSSTMSASSACVVLNSGDCLYIYAVWDVEELERRNVEPNCT